MLGPDDDLVAIATRIDPVQLDKIGETAAILAGIGTYTARRTQGRIELDRRTRHNYGTRKHPVVPEHRCGVTWPGQPLQRHADPPPERCPF